MTALLPNVRMLLCMMFASPYLEASVRTHDEKQTHIRDLILYASC